ncbi:hypothetical protein N431DRAFT_327090 [Stipitochalara longipes BDJ]|nr:hypothetical protein N431DRAFT_327090 [Stipitochalara longipes BDJ]
MSALANITLTAQEQAISVLRHATEEATNALLRSSITQQALEQHVSALEAELRKAKQEELKAAKEINALKEDNAQLQDDLGEAKDEIKMLSQDLELRQKELELEASSNKRLQEEIREFEHRAEDYRHLNGIINSLKEKTKQYTELEMQFQTSELQLEQSKTTIEKLKGRIWGLKDERDLKEPLLHTGVAIRRQFLIQVREKCFRKSSTEIFDAEYVKCSNAAVYEGDGMADEALLLAGYLDIQQWKELFRSTLYGVEPGEFATCYQGFQRARNCWATIQSVQPGRGARPCFQARSEVERRTLDISGEYERDGDAAESSALVQDSIARVEELTKEIVESVRGERAGLIFPIPVEELNGS